MTDLGTTVNGNVPLEGSTVSKPIDVTVSGVNTTNIGIYKVTYGIDNGEDKTQVVVVNDGTYVIGDNYIIRALDFEKGIDANLVSTIKTDGSLELYDKFTGEPVSLDEVNVTYGTPDYNNASSQTAESENYSITFTHNTDSTATTTITATITNYKPTISGLDFKEVVKGGTFDALDGVTANDYEDGPITNIEVVNPVNTDKAGVYKLMYKVEDSDGNVVEEPRIVVVSNENVVVGDTYVVEAYDFEIGIGDVSETTLNTDASLKVYDQSTGGEVSNPISVVDVTYGTPDYSAATTSTVIVGSEVEHEITFTHNSDSNAAVTITATVTNYAPVLNGIAYTELEKDSTGFDARDGITATDYEDDNITANIQVTDTVDTSTPGGYVLEYSITDSDGNETKQNRLVLVKGETVEIGDNYYLQANNFDITSQEAENISDADIIRESNAISRSKANGELGTVTVVSHAITEKPDVYEVVLGVAEDSTVTNTIYVTVTGDGTQITEDKDYLLMANNFTIDLTIPGTTLPTTEAKLREEAGVEIKLTADGSNVADISGVKATPTSMANYKDGIYDITFTYKSTSNPSEVPAEVTVKAIVIDDDSGKGQISGVDYVVVANEFLIDKTDSSYDDSDYDSSEDIVGHAGAVAINAETYEIDTTKVVESDPTTFVDKTGGVYTVDYTIQGTSITGNGKVYVIDNDSVVDVDDSVINASNFKVNVSEATSLTVAEAISKAGATAFDKVLLETLEVELKTPTQLDTIKTGVVGVYPLTFKAVGRDAEKTIYVTVDDGSGVITGDGKYKLEADNFTVDLTNGESLPTSEADIAALASTTVTSTEDGSVVDIASAVGRYKVEPSDMSGYSDGIYDVVITYDNLDAFTGNEAEITVKAIVIDEDSGQGQISGVDYVVVANEFLIDKTDSSYDDSDYDSSEDIVGHAGAVAINADTYEIDTTKVVESDPTTFVDKTGGVYSVDYTIQGTDITGTGKVYVIDNDSVVDVDDSVINASNFKVNVSEATSLTVAEAISRAGATAFDKVLLETLEVELKTPIQLDTIKTGVVGVYPLTFKAVGRDAEKTIYVTVDDGSGVITGDGKYKLEADNFTVDLTNGESLPTSEAAIAALASATVTSTEDGSVVDIANAVGSYKIVPSDMSGYSDGIYDVVITYDNLDAFTGNEAEITVKAIVIDDDSGKGQISGVDYVVVANEFLIDKTDSSYDDSVIVGNVILNAKDISMYYDQSGSIEESVLLDKIGATAWTIDGRDLTDDIVITSTNPGLTNIGSNRIIDVVLSVTDGQDTAQKPISVNLLDVVLQYTYGVVHEDELTTVDFIEEFDIKYVDAITGVEVTEISVEDATFTYNNSSLRDLTLNTYLVDMKIDGKVEKVAFTVHDDKTVFANDKVLFYDKDLIDLTVSEALKYTFKELVVEVNARGFNYHTGEVLNVYDADIEIIDKGVNAGEVGEHTVIIKVNPEADITVIVEDGPTVPITGGFSIVFYVLLLLLLLLVIRKLTSKNSDIKG